MSRTVMKHIVLIFFATAVLLARAQDVGHDFSRMQDNFRKKKYSCEQLIRNYDNVNDTVPSSRIHVRFFRNNDLYLMQFTGYFILMSDSMMLTVQTKEKIMILSDISKQDPAERVPVLSFPDVDSLLALIDSVSFDTPGNLLHYKMKLHDKDVARMEVYMDKKTHVMQKGIVEQQPKDGARKKSIIEYLKYDPDPVYDRKEFSFETYIQITPAGVIPAEAYKGYQIFIN